MSLRTYKGKEMGALLSQIRKEHGDDVHIVEARELGKNIVEIDISLGSAGRATRQQPANNSFAMDLNAEIEQQESPQFILKRLTSIFESQGLSTSLSRALMTQIEKTAKKSRSIVDVLEHALSLILHVDSQLPFQKRVVAFVGPTGVGKTTTVAKLAAKMREAFECNIALISADYYRIGAGYQLQTYASLMHIPCKVLDSRKEISAQLKTALDSFKDYDLVFIDAAGFSPREAEKITELVSLFADLDQVERMLLLPAPGNTKDLVASVKAFEEIGIDRTIITKLDESGFIGPVIEACAIADKPLAFFCAGQRVPEDIEPASLRRLAWRLQRTVH